MKALLALLLSYQIAAATPETPEPDPPGVVDPIAVIDGPSEAEAGNMVVLNSVRSQGDASKWIIPESLEGRYIKSGHQLAFAVRESGEFLLHLVVVAVGKDGNVLIETDSHLVKIVNGLCDPSDPDEPDEPDEPNPPAPDGIFELSKLAAESLDDPPTAKSLAEGIEKAIRGSAETLEDLREDVEDEIEAALLAREGESRSKDWLTIWRRPIDSAVKAATMAEYSASLGAVASGLMAAEYDVKPKPKKMLVKMYTRSNCSWCSKWKREIKPLVIAMGFEVQEITASGSVPVFDITVGEKVTRLEGYQPSESFERFVRELVLLVK